MPRKRDRFIITSPDQLEALLHDEEIQNHFEKGGQLVIYTLSSQPTAEQSRNDILTYVKRIEAFATPAYRDRLEEVWLKVMDDPDVWEILKPTGKASKCVEFNKHALMGVIAVMRNNNMYDVCLTNKVLAHLLEPDDAETYRSSLGKGTHDAVLRRKVEAIIDS